MAITPIGPNDLSGVWQGMIQQETTAETAPMSEYIEQQIGHNLNYLKQQQDAITNTLNNLTAVGALVQPLTNVSSATSPNGKPYLAGLFTFSFLGNLFISVEAVTPSTNVGRIDDAITNSYIIMSGNSVSVPPYLPGLTFSGVAFYER